MDFINGTEVLDQLKAAGVVPPETRRVDINVPAKGRVTLEIYGETVTRRSLPISGQKFARAMLDQLHPRTKEFTIHVMEHEVVTYEGEWYGTPPLDVVGLLKGTAAAKAE